MLCKLHFHIIDKYHLTYMNGIIQIKVKLPSVYIGIWIYHWFTKMPKQIQLQFHIIAIHMSEKYIPTPSHTLYMLYLSKTHMAGMCAYIYHISSY